MGRSSNTERSWYITLDRGCGAPDPPVGGVLEVLRIGAGNLGTCCLTVD
jgi:hypothetical protein